MAQNLLLVFCKNPQLGKVKTRLANGIGDKNALKIYQRLLEKTAAVLAQLNCDITIYYSQSIIDDDVFSATAKEKKVQYGEDLGARMANAFQNGLDTHEKVVIIGTDLWTLEAQDIEKAFAALENFTAVLGPSQDGGYYLLGLTRFIPELFQKKAWGTDEVLSKTKTNLKAEKLFLLSEKNDIDTLDDLKQQIDESKAFMNSKGIDSIDFGIILGTGLGDLVNELDVEQEIPYAAIPHFPNTTMEFHHARLLYGNLCGKKVLVFEGRFHAYEGLSYFQITYPIRLMHSVGIKKVIISNAAGAINLNFKKGEVMLIEDHINLQGGSPLAEKGVETLGPRFVDMSAPYASTLCKCIKEIAINNDITLHAGVYAAVVGPQLETKAEYRYLRQIGADAVGMSTVPEVIVANQLNMDCIAFSVLTDECDPANLKPIDIEDIMASAKKAEQSLIILVKNLLSSQQ